MPRAHEWQIGVKQRLAAGAAARIGEASAVGTEEFERRCETRVDAGGLASDNHPLPLFARELEAIDIGFLIGTTVDDPVMKKLGSFLGRVVRFGFQISSRVPTTTPRTTTQQPARFAMARRHRLHGDDKNV
jgi:hypothetical protein